MVWLHDRALWKDERIIKNLDCMESFGCTIIRFGKTEIITTNLCTRVLKPRLLPMITNSLHSVSVLSGAGWSWWLEHRWLPLQNLAGMSTVSLDYFNVTSHQHPSQWKVFRAGPCHWTKLSFVWEIPAWIKLIYCLQSWSHYTPMYRVPGSKCTLSTKLHTLSLPRQHDTTTSASAVVIKTRTYTFQLFCNDQFFKIEKRNIWA